jgi:hypothetical protein
LRSVHDAFPGWSIHAVQPSARSFSQALQQAAAEVVLKVW